MYIPYVHPNLFPHKVPRHTTYSQKTSSEKSNGLPTFQQVPQLFVRMQCVLNLRSLSVFCRCIFSYFQQAGYGGPCGPRPPRNWRRSPAGGHCLGLLQGDVTLSFKLQSESRITPTFHCKVSKITSLPVPVTSTHLYTRTNKQFGYYFVFSLYSSSTKYAVPTSRRICWFKPPTRPDVADRQT